MKKEIYTEHGGLSMTSAQYLSNLGQEKTSEARESLGSPVFYNTGITLIGDTTPSPMQTGMTDAGLAEIKGKLDLMSRMSAFTAYVREGMKDKEHTLESIDDMNILDWTKYMPSAPVYPEAMNESDWLIENGLEQKTTGGLERPKSPSPEITEISELVKKLPLSDYQKYLELDAKCAVLGQFCHTGTAPLVRARRDYLKKLEKPLEKEGTGRDTCIYTFTPSVKKENLEKIFEELQSEYRETEKKLNKMRFDLREAETQRFQAENSEYTKKLLEYNTACQEIDQYNDDLHKKYLQYRKDTSRTQKEVRAKFEEWKSAERSRISKLKIVIPAGLQDTYEYLESLGKEKESKNQG